MYIIGTHLMWLMPMSQVEVKCPRGPEAANAITHPRCQNTRLACPNPQPSHEPIMPPTPSTCHTRALLAQWKRNYPMILETGNRGGWQGNAENAT